MKIKQKLIDAKNSVTNFAKEHDDAILNITMAVIHLAPIAYIGYAIISTKREMAIDMENGFTEIEGTKYKLSEDGDFITVDQWNEHTK